MSCFAIMQQSVCVCVCVCVCVRACVCVCACVCVHAFLCVCVCLVVILGGIMTACSLSRTNVSAAPVINTAVDDQLCLSRLTSTGATTSILINTCLSAHLSVSLAVTSYGNCPHSHGISSPGVYSWLVKWNRRKSRRVRVHVWWRVCSVGCVQLVAVVLSNVSLGDWAHQQGWSLSH